MTKQKSFKRQVRARMEKTGERYAAARGQMIAAAERPEPEPVMHLSDDSIHGGTGRRWNEWFEVLDAAGAAEWPHAQIARHVQAEHGVSGWWAQSVTLGYERARGRRAPNQHADGFAFTASKTIAAAPEAAFATFHEAEARDEWLPAGALELRTAQPAKSLRANWTGDESRVNVHFLPKEDRTQVVVEHRRLASSDDVQRMKAFWRERLTELKARLEA